MKYFLGAAAALSTAVSAHSWLECTDYDNSQILNWMKANATTNVLVDPGMPWFATQFCSAYPRGLSRGGNWIEQSSNYIWNIAAQSFVMTNKPADTHACAPAQRSPTQLEGAPMATKAPGDTMKLYFGGNGHTRGSNAGGTSNPNPLGPGTVKVYWKGGPEKEITDISEFTKANLLQSNGFAEESFSYPSDPNVKTPDQGLVDKGNWQTIKLPSDMAPGRHMMVWVWYYAGSDAPQWSTCFDVMISGSGSSKSSGSNNAADVPAAPAASPISVAAAPANFAAPAAPAAPVAPVQVQAPAPAVVSSQPVMVAQPIPITTPAPQPPKQDSHGAIETVFTTVDVWTTVWDYQKRSHARALRK